MLKCVSNHRKLDEYMGSPNTDIVEVMEFGSRNLGRLELYLFTRDFQQDPVILSFTYFLTAAVIIDTPSLFCVRV